MTDSNGVNSLYRCGLALAGLLVANTAIAAEPVDTQARPRLVILTDIGGDPDDRQSMIRLMTYANEFDIEGLIASAAGTPGELKRELVRPELIREIVAAYGEVRDSLARHAEGYPTREHLLACIHTGNPKRGMANIGDGHDTEGSRFLIEAADRDDPRPVNIAIWGGSTELAQALWRVREDRGAEGLAQFIDKLRVYAISHQDDTGPWIIETFPELFYVLSRRPEGQDKRESVYRGMYLGGDEALTSREWVDKHVRVGHGPLGALYPTQTWTAPNPHGTLKEGDTPSWFYFLPNGLSDTAHPEWGSWGGRFRPGAGRVFVDAADTIEGKTHARATVWRWRPYFQNDFAARMDWCVQPFESANHPPRAVLKGDSSKNVVRTAAQPGDALELSAADSSDPDGNALRYRWWIYREAGTFEGDVTLKGADTAVCRLQIPKHAPVAGEQTLHVILEVSDDGTPALTAFRRVVVDLAGR